MSVAIAVGGSIGGLTAAIKLKDSYDSVYCFTGFNNYSESSNHGESRGLRTFNLEPDLMDIVCEGWSYWESIGLRGDLIHDCIIHRLYENIEYTFSEKHIQLLEILDKISPKRISRKSKQLNDNTILEDTGIYRIQEIKNRLYTMAQDKGVQIHNLHVDEIIYSTDCVYLHLHNEQNEYFEIDGERCIVSVGNGIKHIKTNMNFDKPLSIWNEFSYYYIPQLYYHDGIWTWGSVNYISGEIYKDRLGFYVMMESEEVLKVACDTSFITNPLKVSKKNHIDYRKHKDNFVTKHLGLVYQSIKYADCYYSVAPFVQHCGPVSIINSGGYGYCVPGFILRAIDKLPVPLNKHYNNHLLAHPRHDLSVIS